jgi:hypothetical protein
VPLDLPTLVTEFVDQKSDRAVSAWTKAMLSRGRPATDVERHEFGMLTLMNTVTEWSQRPEVGGPISVVTLEPGKSIEWFERGVCNAK